MACAWRVTTAKTVASFAVVCGGSGEPSAAGSLVLAGVVRGSEKISWTRALGSAYGGPRGSLKACERSLVSVRWEKRVSRRRVWMWVKVGESIRSEVSSRRRRRGGDEVLGGREGGGVLARGSLGDELGEGVAEGGGEIAVMPDSRRTKSSWSRGGRRCGSHLRFLVGLLVC